MSKRFFVAHTRGPDFNRLRQLGFKTFYPALDDYVFLEDKPENHKLLRKQSELGVAFVKNKTGFVTVSQAEVERIDEGTTHRMEVGSRVLAVEGIGSNLEGEILEETETEVLVRLQGYTRTYEIWTDKQHIVPAEEEHDGKNTGD